MEYTSITYKLTDGIATIALRLVTTGRVGSKDC